MRSAGGRRRDSGIVRMVEAAAHRFADDGAIPNNPALPLLVYLGALNLLGGDPAAKCEAVFGTNDGAMRRNELSRFRTIGGARGPRHLPRRGQGTVGRRCRHRATVRAGDVVVIPAGVGHQNLGAGPDLLVVGVSARATLRPLPRPAGGAAAGAREHCARSATCDGSRLRRRWAAGRALAAGD